MKKPEEKFIKGAIELARRGSLFEKSDGVFSAVVVKNGFKNRSPLSCL